jgi:hypothetical protein
MTTRGRLIVISLLDWQQEGTGDGEHQIRFSGAMGARLAWRYFPLQATLRSGHCLLKAAEQATVERIEGALGREEPKAALLGNDNAGRNTVYLNHAGLTDGTIRHGKGLLSPAARASVVAVMRREKASARLQQPDQSAMHRQQE